MTTRRSWTTIILAVAASVVGIAFALVWWNELPLQRIEQRLAQGDAAGALSAADDFLAGHSGHSQALALRARALVALGRAPEAVNVFEQVGAAGEDDLRAWSTAWLQLGEWSRALSILERLLQIDPARPETLEAAAICQFELGRQQDAAATAKRLAELPGYEAVGQFQLASMYRAWRHATIANEHFRQVLVHRADATGLEVAPAEFFLAYGESLLQSGDARRALEMLERSAALKSNQTVLFRKGEALLLIGDYEKARAVLERLLVQNPDHLDAHERLAEVALQENEPATSLRHLQPLLDRERITSRTAFLLRRAYTSLGDESLAEQWQTKEAALRRTERKLAALHNELRNDPQSPRARLIASYQSGANGNWTSAAQSLAALLRQAPDAYAEVFVQQLAEAIRQRGKLPSLEAFPSPEWSPRK